VLVTGLEVARICFVEYEVMLLAATVYDRPFVRTPEEPVPPGTAGR